MQQLKETLKDYIEGSPELRRVKEELSVYGAWANLSVPELSKNLSFEKFIGGTLYLSARNPAWAQKSHLMKHDIIKQLNDAVGARIVRDIRMTSGFSERAETARKQEMPGICPACGVEGDGDRLCPVCARQKKERKMSSLFKLVKNDPKVDFRAAKGRIPDIAEIDLKRVKRDLKEFEIYNMLIERRSRGRKKGR